MAVRSTCLAATHLQVVGTNVVYTVPAGNTTIVKSLILGTEASTADSVTVSVTPAGGMAIICARAEALKQYDPVELQPYVIMEEGSTLNVNGPNTSCFVYASGSQLVNGEL